MIIECDSCEARGHACGDCVVGVLLGVPGAQEGREIDEALPSGAPIVHLDAPERRALAVLAEQGLVTTLRLVGAPTRRTSGGVHPEHTVRDVG